MFQQEIVVVVWLCKTLTKRFHKPYYVVVSDDAIFNPDSGMLCDCGHWTFGDDLYHVPIRKDTKDVFVYD